MPHAFRLRPSPNYENLLRSGALTDVSFPNSAGQTAISFGNFSDFGLPSVPQSPAQTFKLQISPVQANMYLEEKIRHSKKNL